MKLETLTQVKGIGRWTVQMFLIFSLGRLDVFPTLDLGDSSDLMIGEPTIAVGNPLGFSHSVSTGIVSQPLRLLYTEGAVIVAMTHVLLPFMILPI